MLNWYHKFFKNRTIIFTKSMNGSLYSLQKSIGAVIHNSLDSEDGKDIIETVIQFQKQAKENGDTLKNVLILFDDWITDSSFNRKRGIYDKLYSMARHFNISVITTSQQYTLLPASIRRLAFYSIIYKISNTSE